jgi:hypothetical protein
MLNVCSRAAEDWDWEDLCGVGKSVEALAACDDKEAAAAADDDDDDDDKEEEAVC